MTDPDNHAEYWLRRPTIERLLEERAWTQEALADEIGICRVHFNKLVNRRRRLTRRSRRKLLDCPLLRDIPAEDLWERRPASGSGE